VDAETVRTVAIVIIVVLLAGAVLSALVIRVIVGKLITVVLLAALAVAVWSQRTNLSDCVEQAKDAVTAGQASPQCTFFGIEFDTES
jgi:protein-S-isoprenylcysteine O-methyltransferase Ste14